MVAMQLPSVLEITGRMRCAAHVAKLFYGTSFPTAAMAVCMLTCTGTKVPVLRAVLDCRSRQCPWRKAMDETHWSISASGLHKIKSRWAYIYLPN